MTQLVKNTRLGEFLPLTNGTEGQVMAIASGVPAWSSSAASASASDTVPLADGVASAGVGITWSRTDHVHPQEAAAEITVGTSVIVGGTTGRILYNNGDVLGELATTGSTSVVRATSPTLVTPVLGVAAGTSLALGGATIGANALAVTGSAAVSSTLSSTAHTVTSASATALAVGLAGATNPAFVIDSSTASQAAGLKVTGAATGGTVAVAAIDSGSNANLTINAKGSGTIGIGSVSTGAVTITPATTVTGKLTFGTATAGLLGGAGATGARAALGTTAGNALEFYLNATHTTGDMRANYTNMTFSGIGGSGEAGRFYSIVNGVTAATGGTVNGAHVSIDFVGANAKISGAGNALRATFGISDAAATAVGGTCSTIQVDTFFDTAITVPSNFAFLRFTNTGVKKSSNLARVPNVAAETAGLFCAHTLQAMTHSLRIVSEDGTVYYLMCTNANTNRTEA